MSFDPMEDGFVQSMLKQLAEELKKQRKIDEIEELYDRIVRTTSVEEALQVFSQYKAK